MLVQTLLGVARKHLQTGYAGLHKSPHQEWAFAQRVTPKIGYSFNQVEDSLHKYLLPKLFQGVGGGILG